MTYHQDDVPDAEDDTAHEGDKLIDDKPEGWAGLADTLDETGNRPAGSDFGAGPLDDETPGSQGEIESGSEGDFGVPASGDDDRA